MDKKENQYTISDMIRALDKDGREKIGMDLILIAAGEADTIVHQQGTPHALEVVAATGRLVSDIEDSIFKGRRYAYAEPTPEQHRRHDLKWLWHDAIQKALTDIKSVLKGDDEYQAPEEDDAFDLFVSKKDQGSGVEYIGMDDMTWVDDMINDI